MSSQQRMFLAIALSFGIMLGWQTLVVKPKMEAERARVAALADAGLQAAPAVVLAETLDGSVDTAAFAANELTGLDGGPVPTDPAVPVQLPNRMIEAARSTTKLRFTTEGAGLEMAELQGEREHAQVEPGIVDGFQALFGKGHAVGPQMDLAEPPASQPPVLGVTLTTPSGAPDVGARLRYAVTEEGPGKLVFTGKQGAWEITKTFTWTPEAPGLTRRTRSEERDPTGYQMKLDLQVKNRATTPQSAVLGVHLDRAIEPGSEEAPSFLGGIGNQSTTTCRVGGKLHRKAVDDGKEPDTETGTVEYVAIDQQYFLTAVWPLASAADSSCILTGTSRERSATIRSPISVNPGDTLTRSYGAFLGPKDLELLKNVTASGATGSAGLALDETVDFGIWAVICKALLALMRLFYGMTQSWGLAIILLTVFVKVAMLPLAMRAMMSGEKMRAVQLKLKPQIDAINEKYADDFMMKSQKQQELMQKEGISPFENLGGCLPLLLQIPIWGALFTTLRTSYDLYGEPFAGWADLTIKDPTYVLPLVMGITMLITQRLTPQMSMDKSQQVMFMWIFPIFFSFIMRNYPAGLALYIFTNNVLSIGQQFAIRKYMQARGMLAVTPPTAPKAGATR